MLKDNQQSRWFVVQTKPRQEDVAYENLVRQKFTTYLPKIQLRKKSHNTWKVVIEPLFKNYLFILFNRKTNIACTPVAEPKSKPSLYSLLY